MNLSGRVAVVTGASDGLGRQIALDLSKAGAVLALVGRNLERLKLVKEWVVKDSPESDYFVCDVGSLTQVKETVAKVVDRHGTIDILVNNAGIYYEGPLVELAGELIVKMYETNTLGTIYFTKNVLPIMLKRKSGQILNVISKAAIEPSELWGEYGSTKSAIKGFTESLKKQLVGTGVRVMAFYPGGMDTDIFVKAGIETKKGEPWMMEVEDVSEIVKFMLTRPMELTMDHVEVTKLE